jgi:hypothetical protein
MFYILNNVTKNFLCYMKSEKLQCRKMEKSRNFTNHRSYESSNTYKHMRYLLIYLLDKLLKLPLRCYLKIRNNCLIDNLYTDYFNFGSKKILLKGDFQNLEYFQIYFT